MVPGPVPDVEVALDPRVVVVWAREIAPDRHPQWIGAVAAGTERPAEPGVGAVGDDHVVGPDGVGGAGVLVDDGCPGDQAVLDDGLDRLGGRPQRRTGFHRALCDQVVELAAPHDIPVRREVGVGRPGQLERDAVADRPQAVDALEARQLVGQPHVVQLPHCARGEAVAARFLAREALLVDDGHAVPEHREPVGGRRAGRSRADHQHVGARFRGAHAAATSGAPSPATRPKRSAPSVCAWLLTRP